MDSAEKENNGKIVLVHNQKTKKFNWWKLFFALVFCVLFIVGGGYGVQSYTNTSTFCSSCHEMAPEALTYQVSAHNQINCTECHTKPRLLSLISLEIKKYKQGNHNNDVVPVQISPSIKAAIDNEKCLHCHTKNRLVTATGDLKVNHKGHVQKGIPCIICHAGVAHAKIAERGLNRAQDLDKWTAENTDALAPDKFRKPNMGTCLDCHDKVNNGETPWKDPNYRVAPKPELTASITGRITDLLAQNEKTQSLILQAIGNKKSKTKISMACTTCHKKVKVPATHHHVDWPTNHGSTAVEKLYTCLGCHQDDKWIREVPKQNITGLLHAKNHQAKYVPSILTARNQSRTNQFCKNCHGTRPQSHIGSQWIQGHALAAGYSEQSEKQCYICHDKTTPAPGSNILPAPAGVSCHDCHKFFEK